MTEIKRFKKAVEDFVFASIDRANKGGKDPADWDKIDARFEKTRNELMTWYDRSIKVKLALIDLVKDWNSVPEHVQVPDEINNDQHWQAAKDALESK